MNNYCVYKHIFPNGKVYIGQTSKKPENRWHRGFGYYKQNFVFNAIKKYGWDNIQHQIISEHLTKKEADWLERYLILYYESYKQEKGYNLTLGGDGAENYHHTEETKKKMSETSKRNWEDPKYREKASASLKGLLVGEKNGMWGKGYLIAGEKHPMWGKHHSEETKEKCRIASSGKNNPMYGKNVKDFMSEEDYNLMLQHRSKSSTGKPHKKPLRSIYILPDGSEREITDYMALRFHPDWKRKE